MTTDLVVVGAGVLGIFHAYWAMRQGLQVVLVDRNEWPEDASVRNFGLVIPSAMPRGTWLERAELSRDIYLELDELLELGIQRAGSQYLATTEGEEGVLREFAARQDAFGQQCHLLDRAESIEQNPLLDGRLLRASLWFPGDLRVEPEKVMRRVIQWLTQQPNVTYMAKTSVTAIQPRVAGVSVQTADEQRLSAGAVVVCNGAETRTLYPSLLQSRGVQRCELQMLATAPMRERVVNASIASGWSLRRYASFRQCASYDAMCAEPMERALQERGIHLLITQDDQGGLVIGDSHHYTDGDLSHVYDGQTEALILREAGRVARLPDLPIARRWLGVYSLLPSEELLWDQPSEHAHVVTAIGGKGMTTACGVAREVIASLVGDQ